MGFWEFWDPYSGGLGRLYKSPSSCRVTVWSNGTVETSRTLELLKLHSFFSGTRDLYNHSYNLINSGILGAG